MTTPPGRWQARGVPVGDVDLLALDVGDVDGDGRAEVVGATATEAIVWALGRRAADRAAALAARRAAGGGDAARARWRRWSSSDGAVTRAPSLFADGVYAAARGKTLPAHGWSLPRRGGDLRARAPASTPFAAAGCTPSAGLPERFWTVAGLRGGARPARAAIDPAGTLWVSLGAAALAPAVPLTVRGVGAQVALVALDRGEFVATSEPVQPGEADAIVVRALTAGLPVAYRVDRLPGNVRALAAGDVDGDGRAELVAAVRDRAARRTELWMVN